MNNLLIVVWSFFASIGFGIVFRIPKDKLFFAGLGGALTRCIYLFSIHIIGQRFTYTLIAAMFAALFAEFMAVWKKAPSIVFLYPTMIPLIPGDLFYNTLVCFLLNDVVNMKRYADDCGQSMAGLGIGFVFIAIFIHHKKAYRSIRI